MNLSISPIVSLDILPFVERKKKNINKRYRTSTYLWQWMHMDNRVISLWNYSVWQSLVYVQWLYLLFHFSVEFSHCCTVLSLVLWNPRQLWHYQIWLNLLFWFCRQSYNSCRWLTFWPSIFRQFSSNRQLCYPSQSNQNRYTIVWTAFFVLPVY